MIFFCNFGENKKLEFLKFKIIEMKHLKSRVVGLGLALTIVAGCSQPHTKQKGEGVIKKSDMDLTVKPGVDFFEYSNGNWMKNTPIPEDKSRYGSFDILAENANKAIHGILDSISKATDLKAGSNEQKIKDFFLTGMDTVKINQVGIKPLLPEFKAIDAIKNRNDLRNALIHLHKMGVSSLFSVGVMQDMKDSKTNRMYMGQAGLGLPDRDYYVKSDESSKNIRKEYVKHVSKMFQLVGVKSRVADQRAKKIMAFETRMAKKFNTRLENRDRLKMYNPKTLKQLAKSYPNFNWKAYFKGLGVDITSFVIVAQPKYFGELNKILKYESLNTIKLYLKWKLLNDAAGTLNKEIADQNFYFYSTVLSGVTKQSPRWKRLSRVTGSVLGEAIGQVYVKKYFPPEAKTRMIKLVDNLKKALKKRIEGLTWMSESTRKEALAKLEAFTVKIGYPDKWEDYSKLKVGTDSYVQNMWRAAEFGINKNFEDLHKPVDRKRWGMTPQTVNAYYNPSLNEIVFPAAILQPPFFYMNGDDAVNYGAIGVVIGHEMTHGFDDSGRRFDKNGNMRDWWTAEDAEKFKAKAQKLVDQFDAFEAIDGMHVNGKLTLGENLADYGGLTVSLEAYRMALKGKKPADIDGFTNMQRFFLAYAKVWRQNVRDKALKRLLKEDVHAPGKYRVNGGLFNIPEFYKAFDIKKTDPLYRTKEQRVDIW